MTPAPHCASVYIFEALAKAIDSGNIRETDYIILDEDSKSWFVGPMGVSAGSGRRGFDIIHFIEFDDNGYPWINDDAVETLSSLLAEGLID